MSIRSSGRHQPLRDSSASTFCLLACLVACVADRSRASDTQDAVPDASIDLASEVRDGLDATVVTPCEFTSDCADNGICDSGICRPSPCFEGASTFCYRGLRATCHQSGGSFSLESCGPGRVCLGDGCVDRADNVFIWVGGTGNTMAAPGFLEQAQTSFRELSSRDECKIAPGLYSGENDGLPCECLRASGTDDHFGNNYGVLARYIARSLLTRLGDSHHLLYTLASPPQRESPTDPFTCLFPDERYTQLVAEHPECAVCREPDSCASGRYYFACPWSIKATSLEEYWSKHPVLVGGCGYPSEASDGVPCLPPRSTCAAAGIPTDSCSWPMLPSVGRTDHDLLRVSFEALVREAFVPKSVVDKWFNEKETILPGQGACGGNACSGSSCTDQPCYVHLDPEIYPPKVDYWSSAPTYLWALANLIGRGGTADYQPCIVDSDCGNPNFQCGRDGRCHDDARHCRRNHLVIVDPLSGTMSPSYPTERGRGDFSLAGLARWMSVGLTCTADRDCAEPANCRFDFPLAQDVTRALGRRTGLCSDSGRDPDWITKDPSKCGQAERAAGCGDPFITRALQDAFAYLFFQLPATPFLTDASGQRIKVTTHVVNIEDWIYPLGESYFSGLTSYVARAIATNGGGQWAVPGWSASWRRSEPMEWSEQLNRLATAVIRDSEATLCDISSLDSRDMPR